SSMMGAVPDDQLLDVTATAMVAGGDAIARAADGRVVFVAGALPGEPVTARVVSEHKQHLRAVVSTVHEPSADRLAPPCPELARGCGACQWQHVEPDAQRRFKVDIVTDALR